jgi:predicted nucleic acid-binding protein
LSVLTLGELRVGAYKLHSRRPQEGAKLTKWIEKTESTFSTRVLPVDALIADIWAQFSAERDRPRFDTLIGATASAYGFILVTRNTKDFEGLPIEVLNPWLA